MNRESPALILYVEDDALTLRTVTNRLRRHGFEVLAAESGESALEILTNTPRIDAILLDVQLRGMDGLQVREYLRKAGRHLPVVVCSAAVQRRAAALRSAGIPAECWISKPFMFRDLLSALEQALETVEQTG